ncbi:MAG: LysE family translocator [Burkholderiales bacterium]|nr:LysE family translocator [Burkholderiales bacterium]
MAFLLASFVLAVTPGPGVLYIVTRTLAHGRVAGVGSVAGVACGNFLNAVGAAVGLAALFAVSSLAFTLVKFAGAAYLVWLGVRMLRAPSAAAEPGAPLAPVSVARLFREGLLVALLNPKTTLFFAAFLPQFMHGEAPAMHGEAPALPQAVGLGAIFVGIAACTDLVYALLAAWFAPRLQRVAGAPAWGRWASGLGLIALGVMSALAGQRQTR